MEIIVDAYTPEEQAMGWSYSPEDRLHFPFVARCVAERSISPLRVGLAPVEECEQEMFVLIRWEPRWTSRHARRSRIGTIGSLKGTSCEQLRARWAATPFLASSVSP